MLLLRFLLAWSNSPFVVAAGITALFAALQASGALSLLASGEHGDIDGDAHGDGDADADGYGDHDHDADARESSSIAHALGFGKLPFSLVWQVYAVVFAMTGLVLNARYFPDAPPLASLAWTTPAGLVAGVAMVALLARILGPVFSTSAQEATCRADLVGLMGIVISSAVTEEFGEVRIRDKSGHDVRVVCKLAPGSSPAKEKGAVVVVEYDVDRGQLLVAPLDEEAESQRTEYRP